MALRLAVLRVRLAALRVAPLLAARGCWIRCWHCGNPTSGVLENF